MNLDISDKKTLFRKQNNRNNPFRILVLLLLILAGLFIIQGYGNDKIEPFLNPTAIPTRTAASYSLEGETHFLAGDLTKAIESYQRAVELAPQDVGLWAELARIQTYSTTLLTTDTERLERLFEALESIDTAIEIDPEDSTAHAIRSFILDWLSSPYLSDDDSIMYLTQAEQEAAIALQLDNQNALALAYYAEILVDQQKWLQAEQYAEQALEKNSDMMDMYRIMAFVQESMTNYGDA
nr:tetratricopeptide repeat protein [Anaerolineaceae bacterium]